MGRCWTETCNADMFLDLNGQHTCAFKLKRATVMWPLIYRYNTYLTVQKLKAQQTCSKTSSMLNGSSMLPYGRVSERAKPTSLQ